MPAQPAAVMMGFGSDAVPSRVRRSTLTSPPSPEG
jgi:hypothetical protein